MMMVLTKPALSRLIIKLWYKLRNACLHYYLLRGMRGNKTILLVVQLSFFTYQSFFIILFVLRCVSVNFSLTVYNSEITCFILVRLVNLQWNNQLIWLWHRVDLFINVIQYIRISQLITPYLTRNAYLSSIGEFFSVEKRNLVVWLDSKWGCLISFRSQGGRAGST